MRSIEEISLPQDRYIAALERQRERIANGAKLFYYDDTTPGNKDTACSWGLCSNEKEAWPDAHDHLWPDEFEKYGRVAPKYRQADHKCPLDRREEKQVYASGCFYSCRMFKPKKSEPRPTQEQVLRLYDARIEEARRDA